MYNNFCIHEEDGIRGGERSRGLGNEYKRQGEGTAVDEILDGLAAEQAAGRWQPSADSEARRIALLPQTLPLAWDDLMFQPAYLQALEMLP